MPNPLIFPYPGESKFHYLTLPKRQDESSFLPDILRDLDFKPRRMMVEQRKVTLPFGVSFSRTRIVIDE